MRASDLHRLARQVRELALLATGNVGGDAVTGGELAVLEDLARHPDATVGEITERVGLAQSLVSRICQRMVAEGVMLVRADPGDARRRLLALAPEVRDRAQRLGEGGIERALEAFAPALTDDERDLLATRLDEVVALLERGRPPIA